VIFKCKKCKNEYKRPPSRAKRGTSFCSLKCYHEFTHAKITCVCKQCGKSYQVFQSQRGQIYCSYKCHKESRTKSFIKNCKICAAEFRTSVVREKDNRGKYCSSKCYWQSLRIDPKIKKENARKSVQRYRKAHPEWAQACKSRRRAREVGAEGHYTADEWIEIKNKQNNKCNICGEEKKLTVDHIVPLSKGGSNYKENIQGLCLSCNSRKWVKI